MTPEQIVEAQQLIEDGLTYPEIAQKLGLSQSQVGATLSSVGTHREKLRERRNIIWQMTGEGRSPLEIGEAVGLSVQSVAGIISQQKKYRSFH
jgi:DNA-binding CsgD family transcriptional regulator